MNKALQMSYFSSPGRCVVLYRTKKIAATSYAAVDIQAEWIQTLLG
jgi:hypothetical protein